MKEGLRLDWAAVSHPGQVRTGNEDAALAEDGLFVVADGMGGHVAGEVASRVAVEALRASVASDGIVEAVRVANRAVWERAGEDPSLRGMGTTLAAIALVQDDDGATRLHVVNVGDSRVYLFRDGELEQITEDHSLVAELEREGRLTAEEARVHPQRNIVTRVLGIDAEIDVDEFPVDPFRGDRFLVCSDGLFNEVDDPDIVAVLRAERAPQAAADELVRRANAGGGRDNITVVVVDVIDDGDKAHQASAALAGSAATSKARPIPVAEPDEAQRRRLDEEAIAPVPGPKRLTWRSALFSIALLAVVGAAIGGVWWVSRNTFYVGVDHGKVAIFRGRPTGVLWIKPTVEQSTSIGLGDVRPSAKNDVLAGKEEATLADARAYVTSLTTTTSTTTPATTSTTAARFTPGTPPPTAAAP